MATYLNQIVVLNQQVAEHYARLLLSFSNNATYVLEQLGGACKLPAPLKCEHDTSKNVVTVMFKNGVVLSATWEGEATRYAVQLRDGTVKDVVSKTKDAVIDALKPTLLQAMHAQNLREQLTERRDAADVACRPLLNYLLEKYPRLMNFKPAASVSMLEPTKLHITYSVYTKGGFTQDFVLTFTESVPLRVCLNDKQIAADDGAVIGELGNTLLAAAL